MTLNQTWKNCLRMWKWIDKVWKPRMDVTELKKQWVEKWMPDVYISSDCFFCEYDDQNSMRNTCTMCPGYLVNKRFHCQSVAYSYWKYPKKFYQKLLQLDAKRRAK